MTISSSLAYVDELQALAGDLTGIVDVVICPPYTALWAVDQKLKGSSLQLGAQNLSVFSDASHTGEISAEQLADAGCQWVLTGHWEVRRFLNEDDEAINRKIHLCLEAGLRPVLLTGESGLASSREKTSLEGHLERILTGVDSEQIARMAFIYEPEEKIGSDRPASPEQVARGCSQIRFWISQRKSKAASEQARIIYGGSVTPEDAASLLNDPDVDGLGAGRKGRDPAAFAEIVRQIWAVKKAKA